MFSRPVFGPPVVEAGEQHERFGLAKADLGRGFVEKLALPLGFLRKLTARLLDQFFGLIEGGAAIGWSQIAVELGLNAQEVSEELMFARRIGFAEIGVIIVGLIEAAAGEMLVAGGQRGVVG